ncbi:MAG: chemotaxis-specific protein-glutamate methyltransferase CheB [Chitinivibrionales bacterium]|nr:chemotaxis-specific protein-glutamate methyltransferase CheB [Chitinivibrionales bacterium]MBD3356289.1 chemotaxis-specific protein-glutamate methyltransferase CheB [Chitinivibrionales bacterium]
MSDNLSVLIVDDSLIFRHVVTDALEKEAGIHVAGSVRNGAKALEHIQRSPPDLVTLDVEMPEMNGLQTLTEIKKIERERGGGEIGVIMLSAYTRKGADITIRALELGAFDFVAKPQGTSEVDSVQRLKASLLPKIHYFASRKSLSGRVAALPDSVARAPRKTTPATEEIKALLIGVSTGGPKALTRIMPDLCKKVTVPTLIVQHMPETFTTSLAESLNKRCLHTVKEAREGDVVERETVYIAPGGRHMVLRRGIGGKPIIALNQHPPQNGCRPSVDVLFRSAPEVLGGRFVAAIMTGMGKDGADSLRAINRAGAHIIAQDEASSVVWGMPGSAVATGYVDHVVPLDNIPAVIARIVNERK